MALHVPLFPKSDTFDLGINQAYMFLHDSYLLDHLESWNFNDILSKFGAKSAYELIDTKIVVEQRNEMVKLTFTVPGTISYMIWKMCETEPRSGREILQVLPKHIKLTSQDLKNQLAYLLNFWKIQLFTMPGSAITFVIADDGHGPDHPIEKALDNVYRFSDRIETSYLYIKEANLTSSELWDLIK